MKTISVNFIKDSIPFVGSAKNDWGAIREFDSFQVRRSSGQRVYIVVAKDSMKLLEIAKKMEFKEGNVCISFGKKKVNIGTYTEN